MTAQIFYLADYQPAARTLPIPALPSLTYMVLTMQRKHLHQLTWRERILLARAAWRVAKGDDADPREVVEYMEKIYPIWKRITD